MPSQIFNYFSTEQDLVDSFLLQIDRTDIRLPMRIKARVKEFNFQRGITDVVGETSSGAVVAFEAKLANWRHALTQAHRNLCFADYSFVVLPICRRNVVERHRDVFMQRGVGACIVGGSSVEVVVRARMQVPIQPGLRSLALAAARSSDVQ